MTNFLPSLRELLIEHIEELNKLGILPQDWAWHREKLKDLKKVTNCLRKDLKKIHKLEPKEKTLYKNLKEQLDKLKTMLTYMYNSNNFGRGMENHEAELIMGIIKDMDPEFEEEIKKLGNEKITEGHIEVYTQMLDNMKDEIRMLNSSEEVIRNGFKYPLKLYKEFKKGIKRYIKNGIIPDIGVVGYGSLQSSASRKWTLGKDVNTKYVIVNDLMRGAFFASINRFSKNVKAIGANENLSCMGVKYYPGAWFNGVRLSGMTNEELLKLHVREFYYFLLPCGPAKTIDGETYEFNLICWPIGQTLLRKVRPSLGEKGWRVRTVNALGYRKNLERATFSTISESEKKRLYKLAADAARKELGNPSDNEINSNPALFKEFRKIADDELNQLLNSGSLDIKEDKELSKALQRRYLNLVNNFTSLDNRFQPNLNYMYTCMNIGDSYQEGLFLKSTYCYDPKGKLILFADYLRLYGKTNEKLKLSFSKKAGKV